MHVASLTMHIHPTLLAVLSASSFISTTTARNPGGGQQVPLTQPGDNFSLDPIRDALVSNKVIGDVLNDFEPLYYLDVVYPGRSGVRISLGNEVNVSDVQIRPNLGIYKIPSHGPLPPVTQQQPVTFTIALTDPDAKSRYDPKWSEMCHWIVTNITSSASGLDFSGSIEIKPEDFDDDDDDDGDEEEELECDDYDDEASSGKKNKKRKKKHHGRHHRHHRRNKRCKKDKKGGKCLPGELRSYFPPAPPPKTGWHRYTFVLLQGDASELYGPRKRKHWGYGVVRHGVRDWAISYGLEVVGANFFFAENDRQ